MSDLLSFSFFGVERSPHLCIITTCRRYYGLPRVCRERRCTKAQRAGWHNLQLLSCRYAITVIFTHTFVLLSLLSFQKNNAQDEQQVVNNYNSVRIHWPLASSSSPQNPPLFGEKTGDLPSLSISTAANAWLLWNRLNNPFCISKKIRALFSGKRSFILWRMQGREVIKYESSFWKCAVLGAKGLPAPIAF